MKKILLVVLTLGIGYALHAQSVDLKIYGKINSTAIGLEPVKNSAIVQAAPHVNKKTTLKETGFTPVTIIPIGTSANAYTYGYFSGQRSLLWVDPVLNTVTNFHRMGGALDPDGYSGNLGYDISTDTGQTFINMVECYRATNNNGGQYYSDAARYPNHGIYNPPGNTDPANAYVVFFAPVLDGSNSSSTTGWGGYTYGVASIGDTSYHTKTLKSSAGDFMQYIPDAFEITSQGLAIAVDVNQDRTTDSAIYKNSLILTKGHWDESAGDFIYTRELLYAPIVDTLQLPVYVQVAFSKDGNTGYIVMLADNGSAQQPGGMAGLYPVYWKSTDAGETWEGPDFIQLDGPNGIDEIVYNLLSDSAIISRFDSLVPREEINYTTAFDFNCAVDNHDNLNIAVIVGLTAKNDNPYYIYATENYFAVYDIFTQDGGESWYAEEMGRPKKFRGNFDRGNKKEDNRVQITTSPDHKLMFISWLDTDKPDADINNEPNIFIRGFNPSTFEKTSDRLGYDAPTNVTVNSDAMWQAYFFVAPKYCFVNEEYYIIPFTYEDMDPDDFSVPVQYKYIQDFKFSNSDFIIQHVEENKKDLENQVSVSQNFPNPFTGKTYVNVSLKEGTNVSLEVYTLTGQKVSANNYGYLNTGSHNLTINANNLPTGVYFYTVKAGTQKITRKMIVE